MADPITFEERLDVQKQPPSPSGLALAYLRSSAGWSKTRLAKALGFSESLLSAYERGAKHLTRETLNSLVEPLGHPPEAVDVFFAAHGLIYREDQAEAPSPVALTPEECRIVARAAMAAGATAGRTAAENVRAELIRRRKRQRIKAAKQEAEALFQQLLPLIRKERRGLIEAFPDFWSWAVAVRLCEASMKKAAVNPREALEFADLALVIAERFSGEERTSARLKAYCWAHVGNARRAARNPAKAEDAFAHARHLWLPGDDSDSEWLGEGRRLLAEASCRAPSPSEE